MKGTGDCLSHACTSEKDCCENAPVCASYWFYGGKRNSVRGMRGCMGIKGGGCMIILTSEDGRERGYSWPEKPPKINLPSPILD